MSHGGGEHEKSERSGVLIFTAITFVAVFAVYSAATAAFKHGKKTGEVERVINPPVVRKAAEPERVFDIKELRKPTPELVALGKKVFEANCTSCHGDTGHGDGTGAARLTVKPRNFTTAKSAEYKNGNAPLAILKTLNEGVGGNMPSFPVLNAEQKLAVAHYVREWMPEKSDDSAEAIAAIPAPAAAASGPLTVPDMGPRIAIDFAMTQYVRPDDRPYNQPVKVDPEKAHSLGERLYLTHCASCHGPDGKGGIPYDTINNVPKVRMRAQDLAKSTGGWKSSTEEFTSIVTKGMPGRIKPGIAIFTREEMEALHSHTAALASGRQTASAATH